MSKSREIRGQNKHKKEKQTLPPTKPGDLGQGAAQLVVPCLAHTRPWVQSPGPPKQSKTKQKKPTYCEGSASSAQGSNLAPCLFNVIQSTN